MGVRVRNEQWGRVVCGAFVTGMGEECGGKIVVNGRGGGGDVEVKGGGWVLLQGRMAFSFPNHRNGWGLVLWSQIESSCRCL